MTRPPLKVDAQLEASLRRMTDALDHHRSQHAAMVGEILAATSAEVAERMSAKTARITARLAERHQRRLDRWRRHEERRAPRLAQMERHAGADVPRGIVFAIAAAICVGFALREPGLFWMVFVALGFGLSAASAFSRAARRARQTEGLPSTAADQVKREVADQTAGTTTATGAPEPAAPRPRAEAADPRVERIQSLCDKLLAELESGPPIVREVVTEPHATIGGLRQACLETARRERELRSVLASQDEARLVAERDALAARLAAEHDAIVHDRLGQALGALEQQLAHRAELTTAAARLEAENTRILYTLENLHMQLLRARSTDIGAPELGGKLRDGLRALGSQIDAVAEALEWASTPPPPALAPPAAPTSPTASAESAQTERAAAAQRAAQARNAQRR